MEPSELGWWRHRTDTRAHRRAHRRNRTPGRTHLHSWQVLRLLADHLRRQRTRVHGLPRHTNIVRCHRFSAVNQERSHLVDSPGLRGYDYQGDAEPRCGQCECLRRDESHLRLRPCHGVPKFGRFSTRDFTPDRAQHDPRRSTNRKMWAACGREPLRVWKNP